MNTDIDQAIKNANAKARAVAALLLYACQDRQVRQTDADEMQDASVQLVGGRGHVQVFIGTVARPLIVWRHLPNGAQRCCGEWATAGQAVAMLLEVEACDEDGRRLG